MKIHSLVKGTFGGNLVPKPVSWFWLWLMNKIPKICSCSLLTHGVKLMDLFVLFGSIAVPFRWRDEQKSSLLDLFHFLVELEPLPNWAFGTKKNKQTLMWKIKCFSVLWGQDWFFRTDRCCRSFSQKYQPLVNTWIWQLKIIFAAFVNELEVVELPQISCPSWMQMYKEKHKKSKESKELLLYVQLKASFAVSPDFHRTN